MKFFAGTVCRVWCACLLLSSFAFAEVDQDPSVFLPGVYDAQEVAVTAQATVKSYSNEEFVVVFDLKLPEHWHTYYQNPGTAGLPMTAELAPVEGFEAKGPFFSMPQRLESELGISYGYEHPAVAFKIKPLPNAPAKAAFEFKAMLQMCKEGQCLPPTDVSHRFDMVKGDGAKSENASQLTASIVGLDSEGIASSGGSGFHASVQGESVLLKGTLPGPAGSFSKRHVYFFSADGEILPTAPQTLTLAGDGVGFELALQRNTYKDALYPNMNFDGEGIVPPLKELKGILSVDGKGIVLDLPIETPKAVVKLADVLTIMGLLFVGGLLLNLMPCVFPVIGLKILGFVELGGGERKKVVYHSLIFVAGVVISFWVLTALLVMLKESLAPSGQTVNWAVWMESPDVVYGLLLLLLVLGLSMYGVFEIGVRATGAGAGLQSKKSWAGSFWSGVLVTVIATPCSAPFLGAAMSSALDLPTWGMFTVFTAMALGVAFPYLLLSLFPSLMKYMPKPGAWMESFKQGLSFLLFGAVAWLLWIYSGINPSLGVFFGLVIFASAWWVYGRWCAIHRTKKTRLIGLLAAIALGAAGIYYSAPFIGKGDAPILVNGREYVYEWKTWSKETQNAAIEEGRPVYVDFTAKWCNTCLFNKEVAYSQEVIDLFAKHDVLLLKADKTTRSPEIDTELRALGRSAVPVNVLYVPGDSTPHITREILTAEYLADFLREKLDSADKNAE